MIYKKIDAEKFTITGGTEGIIFPSSPKGDQTVAYVEMDGIYPEKGYSINSKCTETICLIDGSFSIEISGKKYMMKKGDICMILPGNKYRIVGKGKSFDFITPAWDKKQNKIVEN